MATVNIYDMADTWNNGATLFTAIKMNVTDTASDVLSNLLDLQVSSTSQFRVGKGGAIRATSWNLGSAGIFLGIAADALDIYLVSTSRLGWVNNSSQNFTYDLTLFRDAANTLAQRNGTNAQVSRFYRTFTDASNYERLALQSSAGIFEIAAETAGTGTDNIDLQLTPAGTGNVRFGTFTTNASVVAIGYITIKDAAGTTRLVEIGSV